MSSAGPLSSNRPARLTFETRSSDFVETVSGNLYSGGCCCCCCCLHWVAAVAGGIVGVRGGWIAAQKEAPIHPAMRSTVSAGFVLGFVVVGILGALTQLWIVLAFAPSLVFLPALGSAALLVAWKGARLRHTYARARRGLTAGTLAPPEQGVFRTSALVKAPRAQVPALMGFEALCRRCLHTLWDSEVLAQCPQCDAALDSPKFPVVSQGLRLAVAAGGRAFLWSTALSIVAYGIMYLALIVLG